MHHLCENFNTLMLRDLKLSEKVNPWCMSYLLAHDSLKVVDEHETLKILWKYSAMKEPEEVSVVIPQIRAQFLVFEDLLVLARDHKVIRQCEGFKHVFTQEYYRRIAGKPVTERPRQAYAGQRDKFSNLNHNQDFIQWMLSANHHEGFERRIDELKTRYADQRTELLKKKENEAPRPFVELPETTRGLQPATYALPSSSTPMTRAPRDCLLM